MLNFQAKFGVVLLSATLFTTSVPLQYTYAASPDHQETHSTLQSYIIGFHSQPDESLIQELGGIIHTSLHSIQALSVSMTTASAQKLSLHPSIKFMEQDKEMKMEEQRIDSTIYTLNYPKPEVLQQEGYYTGNGVKVGILDTGIDTTHEDLQVAGGISFVPNTTSYNDDNGHGTHVAGIIAAQDNQVGIKGLAPDVQLYSIKVLDDNGLGQYSQIIKGIEWATQQGFDIANLSLTGKESSTALRLAVDEAYKKGLYIIAASGNHLDSTFNENQSVYYPARYESVIAVGAVDKNNKHPKFSGSGPELEVVAPGVDIYSSFMNNTYETHTGTSMATPYVTAIYALYKEAYPNKTTAELRKMIQNRAKDLGVAGRDVNFGFGLIQAPDMPDKIPPTTPQNISYKIAGGSKIHLTWTASKDRSPITGYNIYRNGKKVKSLVYGLQYSETVKPGFYKYEVSAVDEAGNESNKSGIDTKVYQLFSDVRASQWFSKYVYDLNARHAVGGLPDGKFHPGKQITRGEAVSMIGRALKLDGTPRNTSFPDVTKSYFASGYVASMTEQKLASGFQDGTFKPTQTISRGEVIALLDRAFTLKNQTGKTKSFKDVTKSFYAYDAIQRFASVSIANGYTDGAFKPNNPVTRAEMAVFLSRTIEESN
ncbi:S8 family peptidase [Fictibacillus phosphorivorans]|uniref:S8 family peptidase n=1 Tax=Fictibacillus phosphorivorans TaxID=1221500 RepID=UPI0020400FF0|nr:S8 family serine peptidase [Fictibacillus phosphorivorans]MCM3718520.1 S8 family serine peptidase [Fictibacillus phosphorivorans]MCM3776124.1 S8 family serine peptidase [Fictibacillus phosphorivorans]